MKETFSFWLKSQMDEREWSQADLARRSKISPPHIARLLSDTRALGNNGAAKLAKAFNMPVEIIYREAGMLPPQMENQYLYERVVHLFNQLSKSDQMEIIEYLEMKIRFAEKRKFINSTNKA